MQQKSTTNEPTSLPPATTRDTARLENRYATALYELAQAAGAVDRVGAELAALHEAMTDAPDFARALNNPVLNRAAQGRALAAIASKQGAGTLVQNFLKLVASKGRQAKLPAIIKAYLAIVAAARGELTAEVRSAAPLTETQQQDLIRALASRHGAQSVKLETIVDPQLLGGFSVKIGATLYDRTLSGQLNRLMLKLKEAA